jgi:uncharacterized protein (DUF2141 family)
MAKGINIPQYAGGNNVPQATYNAPKVGGQTAVNIVDAVTEKIQKVDLEQAAVRAKAKGQRAQTDNKNYVGMPNAFSVTAQAFNEGANSAFIINKSNEAEGEIDQLYDQHKLDPEKFQTRSEEYRNKWLGTLPEQLQGDLNNAFTKVVNQRQLQIQANVRQDTFSNALNTHMENSDKIITNISTSVKNQGYTDSLQDYFAGLNAMYVNMAEKFNLTGDAMRKIKAGHRQNIIEAFIYADFQKVKNDPEKIKALKEQIQNGTYTLDGNPLGGDEEGFDFSMVIPGGDVLKNVDEITAYSAQLDKLEEDERKIFANNRSMVTDKMKNLGQRVSNGEEGIVVEDGTIKYNPPPFPENEYRENFFTEQEINEAKIDYASKIEVGLYRTQAITSSLTKISQIKSDLQSKINELDPSDNVDSRMIKTYVDALEAVEQEETAKIEAFKPGNNATDYFIKKFGKEVDLSNGEESLKFMSMISQNTGVPVSNIAVSKTQANIEMTALDNNIFNGTDDSFKNTALNLYSRQGKLMSSYVSTSLSNQKGNIDGYSKMTLVELAVRDEDTADYKVLYNAIKGFPENKNVVKQRTDITSDDVTKKINTIISSRYGKGIDQDTDLGKAMVDTINKIMYQSLSNTDNNLADAEAVVNNFISNNFVQIQHNVGDGYTWMSKNVADGFYIDPKTNNAVSRHTTITKIINNIRSRPHAYGIKLSDGTNYDELDQIFDKSKIVQHNGQLVLKGDNDLGTVVIFQKLPSAADNYFYGQFTVSPDPTEVPHEDAEFTWNYTHDKPNWFKQFNATKGTTTKKSVAGDPRQFGDGQTVFDVPMPDSIDDWGAKFAEVVQKELFRPITATDTGDMSMSGDRLQVYEDSFSALLFNDNTNEKLIADGISLALNKGKLDDNALQWLGNKSSYLSALKDEGVREYVNKVWNREWDTLSSRTTMNDVPVTMSKLQVLTDIVRQAPSTVYKSQQEYNAMTGGA